MQFDNCYLLPDVADRSAAVPLDAFAIMFPGLRDLIEAVYKVWVRLGCLLKSIVKVEESTVKCWSEKINEHQKVGSRALK
jgi:exonuclease VII large subunit